ncbi:MAG: hypothetical protein ABJL99_13210 [Aliishimia sp.]
MLTIFCQITSMKWTAIICCTGLAACNTPGPHFRDLEATRVSFGTAVFDVRVRGDLAEAIRLNRQYAPRLSGVAPLAAHAIRQVSGCEVTEIRGDAALMLGLLECDGREIDPALRRAKVQYDCYLDDHLFDADHIRKSSSYSCDQV